MRRSRTFCIRLSKYSYLEGKEHTPENVDPNSEQNGEQFAELLALHFERVRFCFEIGKETELPHWHYLVQNDEKKVNFDTIKRLNRYAHIEDWRRGYDLKGYIDYMDKTETAKGTMEDEFKTFPEMKQDYKGQGNRTDWDEVREMFESGKSVCEVLYQFPHLSINVGALEKLRATYLSQIWSRKLRLDLEVSYISGEAGSGKSRYVLEKYGLENVYRVTDYKHPFDNYQSQPVIVFEEFRNSIPFEQMLNILDIYPCELPSRYANKVACYTKVYIISNWDYSQQFEKVRESHSDSIGAWDRRVHYIYQMQKGGILTALKTPNMQSEQLTFFDNLD